MPVSRQRCEDEWELLRSKGANTLRDEFRESLREKYIDPLLSALENDEPMPELFFEFSNLLAQQRGGSKQVLKATETLSDAQNEQKGQIAQGKRISRNKADLELYRAILRHDRTEQSITAFCDEHRTTRNRYYRVKENQYTHPEDRKLINDLKRELNLE